MATVGQLLISLAGDSKPYSQAINESGKLLQSFVKEVEKAGKKIEEVSYQWIAAQKRWGSDAGKVWKQYSDSLGGVKQGLVDTGRAVSSTQSGITTLATKAVTANEDLKQLTNTLKGVSNQLWLMTMGLQQFGRTMTTAFTVPLAAAAGLSTKVFMDWESGSIAIQRAAEITTEEAKKITDAFIEISQQVPITVEELQKAGYAAAQAGITGEEGITNFALAAVKLSKVGGDAFRDLPIEKLANNLAKLSIAFGVAEDDMEAINNTSSMMLAVAKAVPGGLGEIVEAMRRVAGSAATYGVSMEQAAALTGTLVAAGVPAARAGTELARVFENMVSKIDLVGEVMGYTGDELMILKERMEEDMGEVLNELIGRLGATEDMWVKNAVASEIFGETGKKALLPLINNYDLLQDLQARANQELESGALLSAEFDLEASSLTGTLKVFANNLRALGKVIGDDLAPYVSYFLKTFTLGVVGLIKAWQNLSPAFKFAIFLLGSMLAIVGPLALALNTMFLAPLSGLITFITHQARLLVQLGIQTALTNSAAAASIGFGGAMAAAATGVLTLAKAMAILSLKFVAVLGVIGLVAAALYGIGKLLGIGFKLPTLPKINLPKFNKLNQPKLVGEGVTGEEVTEKDKKAAKKRQKAIEKDLRDKKRARQKELRELEKSIDAYEKIRKAEIKIRQKLVNDQKDALDLRKEQWEDEKRIEDEKIRAQEETLEITKATLKKSKRALRELQDAQDQELDNAENKADYAELNLKAAQNALKREKILGRDEFDASFRAAEARVKAWEDAAQLADENVIKVKRVYQKQIEAQKDIVEANQDQADLEVVALDDLRDALKARRAIVDKEIDLLNDELKIRQKALSVTRDNTQEKLDLLREEKQVRQTAWDDEISIIQDQLDAARDQAQAISDMPLPELPDIAGSWQDINDELEDQYKELQGTMGASFDMGGPEVITGGLIDDYKKAWGMAKESAEIEGKSAGFIYVKALYDSLAETTRQLLEPYNKLWMDFLFGKGTWDRLNEEAEEKGKSLVGYLWGGFVEKIGILLSQVKQAGKDIVGNIAQGIWDGLGWVRDAIRAIGTWPMDGLKNVIGNAKQWGKDMIGGFAQGIWDGMIWVKDAIRNMADWIKGILHFSEPDFGPLKGMNSWGKDMIKSYIDGIESEIPNLENVLSEINVDKNTIGNSNNLAIKRPGTDSASTPVAPSVVKNYYIQPGQMIATRGEVRSFVRLLKEYETFEKDR